VTRAAATDRAPWYFVVPGAIAIAFLALPVLALLAQAPWGDLASLLTSEAALTALRLSLVTSVAATGVALVLGIPLAWLMARTRAFGGSWVRALVMLPLVLPPVVGGVALLLAFGRRGLAGQLLYDAFGIQIPFTTAAVVIAEAFVAMPFLVITVEGALRSSNRRLEQAAATLGADRWTVFRRVTLPLVLPSIAAGAVLCWARALGEFGATLTFAGSFPGVTRTMPLAVYAALDVDRSEAIALSVVLLLVSVAILVSLRGQLLQGLRR
jgi:molybdate transport system permease protein